MKGQRVELVIYELFWRVSENTHIKLIIYKIFLSLKNSKASKKDKSKFNAIVIYILKVSLKMRDEKESKKQVSFGEK